MKKMKRKQVSFLLKLMAEPRDIQVLLQLISVTLAKGRLKGSGTLLLLHVVVSIVTWRFRRRRTSASPSTSVWS